MDDLCSEDGQSVCDNKIVAYSVTVAKISFLWFNVLLEQIKPYTIRRAWSPPIAEPQPTDIFGGGQKDVTCCCT